MTYITRLSKTPYHLHRGSATICQLENTTSRLSVFETCSEGGFNIDNKMSGIFLLPSVWFFPFLIWKSRHLFISCLSLPTSRRQQHYISIYITEFYKSWKWSVFVERNRSGVQWTLDSSSIFAIQWYENLFGNRKNAEKKLNHEHLSVVFTETCLNIYCYLERKRAWELY